MSDNGKPTEREELEFLRHKLEKSPEYRFAQKLTNRLVRDLKLYTSITAEILMLSNFRQKDTEHKVPLQTQFICNEVGALDKTIQGVGFTFVLSSENEVTVKKESTMLKFVTTDLVEREVIFNLDDKGVIISLQSHIEDNITYYGSYKLKSGKMSSDLLIEFMGWLIHENSYPPTPLSSRHAADALEPYSDNLLLDK